MVSRRGCAVAAVLAGGGAARGDHAREGRAVRGADARPALLVCRVAPARRRLAPVPRDRGAVLPLLPAAAGAAARHAALLPRRARHPVAAAGASVPRVPAAAPFRQADAQVGDGDSARDRSLARRHAAAAARAALFARRRRRRRQRGGRRGAGAERRGGAVLVRGVRAAAGLGPLLRGAGGGGSGQALRAASLADEPAAGALSDSAASRRRRRRRLRAVALPAGRERRRGGGAEGDGGGAPHRGHRGSVEGLLVAGARGDARRVHGCDPALPRLPRPSRLERRSPR
mmetsp:Transcript_2550/g.8274  ORF Transcript_2550/g.8274 Transcript_2550/m.8274 type:complete len:286 (-) Transcript_2550:682-1539(-)